MILEIIFAFFGTIGFTVIFSVPKKQVIWGGITGAIGWAIYLLVLEMTDSVYIATLFSAFGLTRMARYLSIYRKSPATLFLIAGIFTLVPGAGVYQTTYHIFMNQPDLGSYYFMNTVKIALQIALGIMVGYILPPNLFTWFKDKFSSKSKKLIKE